MKKLFILAIFIFALVGCMDSARIYYRTNEDVGTYYIYQELDVYRFTFYDYTVTEILRTPAIQIRIENGKITTLTDKYSTTAQSHEWYFSFIEENTGYDLRSN